MLLLDDLLMLLGKVLIVDLIKMISSYVIVEESVSWWTNYMGRNMSCKWANFTSDFRLSNELLVDGDNKIKCEPDYYSVKGFLVVQDKRDGCIQRNRKYLFLNDPVGLVEISQKLCKIHYLSNPNEQLSNQHPVNYCTLDGEIYMLFLEFSSSKKTSIFVFHLAKNFTWEKISDKDLGSTQDISFPNMILVPSSSSSKNIVILFWNQRDNNYKAISFRVKERSWDPTLINLPQLKMIHATIITKNKLFIHFIDNHSERCLISTELTIFSQSSSSLSSSTSSSSSSSSSSTSLSSWFLSSSTSTSLSFLSSFPIWTHHTPLSPPAYVNGFYHFTSQPDIFFCVFDYVVHQFNIATDEWSSNPTRSP